MLRGSHAHERWTWLPLNMFYEVHFNINQQLAKSVDTIEQKGIGSRLDPFRGVLIISIR